MFPEGENFYLVEKGQKIVYLKGNLLDDDGYQRIIYIEDVLPFLWSLKDKSELEDWKEFESDNFLIGVVLNARENFYDDENPKINDIKKYVQQVSALYIRVFGSLSDAEQKRIDAILQKFSLDILYPPSQERFKNSAQLNAFLEKIKPVAKS